MATRYLVTDRFNYTTEFTGPQAMAAALSFAKKGAHEVMNDPSLTDAVESKGIHPSIRFPRVQCDHGDGTETDVPYSILTY